MAILTNSGRSAIAEIISDLVTVHLAWGRGLASWDANPEAEPTGALSLVDEVGRRKAAQVLFCTPSASGDIDLPNGTFAVSAEPTRYLYTRFNFDYADAAGETIRELGVFLRTEPLASVPESKAYLLPSEIENPGRLFLLERITKLVRLETVRQQYQFVVRL